MPFWVKRVYDPPPPRGRPPGPFGSALAPGAFQGEGPCGLVGQGARPSDSLRRWFGHDPEKYPEFVRRYREELKENPALARLKALGEKGAVTLLHIAKERRYNNAQALLAILEEGSLTGEGGV